MARSKMPFLLRLILALGLLATAWVGFVLPQVVWEVRDEREENRRKGCRCPVNWLGIYTISPECPVHGEQCTVLHHQGWYGRDEITIPYTSVARTMVCQECFDRLSEYNIELFHFRQVGECAVCNKKHQVCIRVPTNLIRDWIDGKVYHAPWE
jgi:hypothetical protein